MDETPIPADGTWIPWAILAFILIAVAAGFIAGWYTRKRYDGRTDNRRIRAEFNDIAKRYYEG